ncbi:MAG TPA: tRNA pseudouridine(38-40) synthase TruA [Acidimicrobiia bacterium]|nr:tRNA pseudouridine(38-40) synthase TruA [Acidimicrobiia bacterium]
MPVVRLDLAYDGSEFHGFARQPGVVTVQGALEAALHQVLGEEVVTVGAGRTDTGVHAQGQVVSMSLAGPVDLVRLQRSLNGLLHPAVVVRQASLAGSDFDARRSAGWRSYRYQILNSSQPDPLRRWTTWHVPVELAVPAMNQAAAEFVGEHDFAAFCRRSPAATTVRNVLEASWHREHELVVFAVRATAFCHQMVRSLVGFMVEVGKGARSAEEAASVLATRDRQKAGQMAPPQGLILWEVGYE